MQYVARPAKRVEGTGYHATGCFGVRMQACYGSCPGLHTCQCLCTNLLSGCPSAPQGAEAAPGARGGGGGRLEFEKQGEEADPFGLDAFLSEVKGGGRDKGGRKTLDAIGQRGGMAAAGGGASLEDAGAGAGMGRRMQFTSGSGR